MSVVQAMFNPRPDIHVLPIDARHDCLVIDDALLEPERLVEYAAAHRHEFRAAAVNAYPGIELRMPDAFSTQLGEFFRQHARNRLGARRVQSVYSRLSMVTLAPEQLQPAQWFCHRDRLVQPPQCSMASMLYLFRDESLGGTSFYRPRRSEPETLSLARDSSVLPAEQFQRKYGIQRGYMLESNAWFEHVLRVPARWNRLVFYNGDALHSGDIRAPQRLNDDPRSGRLSLNGFLVCTRALA